MKVVRALNGGKEEAIIRSMTEDDISQVLDLDQRVSGLQRTVAYSGVVDSYVGGELGLSCVAEAEGKIVGYILGRLAYSPPPLGKSAWIQIVGVAPEHRRRGIGRRLVAAFLEQSRTREARPVHISVPLWDEGSQKFLQGCGFTQAKRILFTHELED